VPSNFRAKGSAYRAMVKNLPMSASWQDLKVTHLSFSVSTQQRHLSDTYHALASLFLHFQGVCTPYLLNLLVLVQSFAARCLCACFPDVYMPCLSRGIVEDHNALLLCLSQNSSDGVPPWQDHFRKVCTPNYVNVFRDRGGVLGVVEFDSPEDLARAIRKLDDTEFRNPFERAYIRVVDDSDATKGGGGGRGRSRSRSRHAPAPSMKLACCNISNRCGTKVRLRIIC
jgi:hypothetical protein